MVVVALHWADGRMRSCHGSGKHVAAVVLPISVEYHDAIVLLL
jgi:hypothetical protein